MIQFAEYHSHSKYSDGKMSMEELVCQARVVGLETIGISDHGFMHMFFGVKRNDYAKMRDEIDRLKEKYDDINILLGVEANILDRSGNIDVDDKIYNIVDYVLAGYHFGSRPKTLSSANNHIKNYFKIANEKDKEYNTQAIVNTIRNNKILAITHPGDKGDIYTVEVAKEAAKYGIALEISNHHEFLSFEQLQEIKSIEGLKYTIGADAHFVERIGHVKEAIERAEKVGINVNDIINCR